MLLFFQLDITSWDKILGLPYALIVLVLVLWFILKALPTWKEVKLADNESRKAEAAAIGTLSTAIISLSNSQSQFSAVVNNLAIEQKRSLDQVRIMQRVSVSSSDILAETVQQLADQTQILNERVEQLEGQNNETGSTQKI
jgi:hypothetical protein